MDFNFAHLVVWYLVFVFSTTCHEYAHALVAYKGGDLTAYEGGQLSLDPVPHIRRSPVGMLLIPLISYPFMGWMIGWASVPYNLAWARRRPGYSALMSAAGPFSNFLLAALSVLAMRLLLGAGVFEIPRTVSLEELVIAAGDPSGRSVAGAVAMALSVMASLNVLLGLFNLIPLPPLDGSGVIEGLSPRHAGRLYDKLREQPLISLLLLVMVWRYFGYVAVPALGLTVALVRG